MAFSLLHVPVKHLISRKATFWFLGMLVMLALFVAVVDFHFGAIPGHPGMIPSR